MVKVDELLIKLIKFIDVFVGIVRLGWCSLGTQGELKINYLKTTGAYSGPQSTRNVKREKYLFDKIHLCTKHNNRQSRLLTLLGTLP